VFLTLNLKPPAVTNIGNKLINKTIIRFTVLFVAANKNEIFDSEVGDSDDSNIDVML